ncbi:MAG: hypothetical protein HY425_01925 [Candidatus Levybacteria bacterium]|nr:hypothetical protein [Candidatus Levybacteria bacterium]
MANPEKDFGHTKFYCAQSTRDNRPFGLRFDPAIFYDDALRIMLATQVNYVLSGYGFVSMRLSNSKGETTKKINISQLSIMKQIAEGKNSIGELFSKVRRPGVTKVVIVQEKSAARRFIEEEMLVDC